MPELTCIVCPIGCRLSAETAAGDGEIHVTGNRCPRGAAYAVEEIRAPKRVVTATCALGAAASCADGEDAGGVLRVRMSRKGLCDPRRVPVKSSVPCPKERIRDLLSDIYAATASPPVKRGDVVIKDWNGMGIDVVATRTLD